MLSTCMYGNEKLFEHTAKKSMHASRGVSFKATNQKVQFDDLFNIWTS